MWVRRGGGVDERVLCAALVQDVHRLRAQSGERESGWVGRRQKVDTHGGLVHVEDAIRFVWREEIIDRCRK